MIKPWLKDILELGLVPYVSTSANVLPSLDMRFFAGHQHIKLLEEEQHKSFHQAYLLANSLGFGSPDLKMPNWVYIDCVLMQTAVIGFALPVAKMPKSLLAFFEDDAEIDVSTLDIIPVSGQIAAMGMDGKTITGYSLFSLKPWLLEQEIFKQVRLGCLTKYAALKVYEAEKQGRVVMGISQYDNPALKIHGAFGRKMYIEQPIVPLHPKAEMTFTYSMKAVLDDARVLGSLPDDGKAPDVLMNARDTSFKHEMQRRIRQGERFYIKDPIQIKKDNEIYLPICVEK